MKENKQVEGKAVKDSLGGVNVRKAASLGNAPKAPKKSGQLGD